MNCIKYAIFSFSIVFVGLTGCLGDPAEDLHTRNMAEAGPEVAAAFNRAMIDYAVAMLQDGDMVLRIGNDATSHMLTRMNLRDKTFSHCGLVRIEHGYPFVYHAIGGEDNPDEELRRDSAKRWLNPVSNNGLGIARFQLDTSQQKALSGIIVRCYKDKVRFDMDFEMATDDRLYCAEFIYKAVSEAASNPVFFTLVKAYGYTYINVENLYLNPHTKLIWQVRYK